eukprot:1189487-Prorocentrum_minimum.AAC.1
MRLSNGCFFLGGPTSARAGGAPGVRVLPHILLRHGRPLPPHGAGALRLPRVRAHGSPPPGAP